MSYRRDDRGWDYRRRDPRDRNYSPPPRDHRDQRDGRDRDFRGGRPPWDDRPFRPANRARSPPPSGGFRDNRDNRDIRGRDGERDRERDRYPYSRDRSRDRTPPRPSLNAPGPSRPLSVRGSPPRPSRDLEKSGAKGRSATPEEGQITSPVPPPSATKPPERRRSPPPASTFRRRSPSPPPSTAGRYRFDSGNLRDGRDRDRDREPPWQRRDRGDRDRPFTRDRSRSPPSLHARAPPPPSRSNRGRSPSISSSSSVSRSTRSPSSDKRIPEKRAYSPARSRRPYSPKRRSISPPPPTGPGSSRRSIDRRSVDRAPVEPERKPRIPVPVPLSGVKPPWAERAERRLPPSGPRSDRIPTGPRALSGGPPIVPVAPLARTNPYAGPTATPLSSSSQTEAKSRYEPISINTNINTENTIAQDRSNPYHQPTPSSSTPSGRLSWSERKALSPQKSAQPLGPDPIKPSVIPSGPSYNSQENLHRAAESNVKVDMDPSRVPPKQPSSSPVKQLSSLDRSQPDSEAETRDVKMDVDDQMAGGVKLPEELAAEQRRQEEERIMRELPALQVPFGLMQWEIDLNAHYKHVQTLAAQTSRAQTAARLAQAFLADAEAERLAAVDRRRIAESQLNGSLGTGLLGTGT